MPDTLVSILNKYEDKCSIGYSTNGYDEVFKYTQGNLYELLMLGGVPTTPQSVGGTSGVGDISGLENTLENTQRFFMDREKKLGYLTIVPAFAIPLKDSEGNTFICGDSKTAGDGYLGTKRNGVPYNIAHYVAEALCDGELHAGIMINLQEYGMDYMKYFWQTTMTYRELRALVDKNYLCAELVVHSTNSLSSSGKTVYAHVVGELMEKGSTMYVSPIFASLKQFSGLGLNMTALRNSTETIDVGTATLAGDYQYDYKTGKINGLTKSDIVNIANVSGFQAKADLVRQISNACRIRLFVPKDMYDAADSLVGGTLPKEFWKTNSEISYTGGQEVQAVSGTLNGTTNENIARLGIIIMEYIATVGVTYVTTDPQFRTLSNVPSSLKGFAQVASLDKFNLTQIPTHTAQVPTENVNALLPRDSAHSDWFYPSNPSTYITCDCSGFVSWVLMEAGIAKTRFTTSTFKSGTFLKSGYSLRKISSPVSGCIGINEGEHMALYAGSAGWQGFGATRWLEQYIKNTPRRNWVGKTDNSSHGRPIKNVKENVNYREFYEIVWG